MSRSTTTGRSRLRSPVKKISDMSLLDKPCVAMSWSEASRADVLDVDTVLRRDLEEISQSDRPVVPRAIEEDLRSVLGDDFYIPARVFGDLGHDLKKAAREFDTIRDIVKEADRCVTRRCCEAQWNAEVHSRYKSNYCSARYERWRVPTQPSSVNILLISRAGTRRDSWRRIQPPSGR
ncbi:uncharacterized protein B0I36DRAFT_394115 [Microdochium trichocladiopsis]|uniref:PD-(D/E)XK nuclease-like domain-containing protein n=1 Tax=Microdochium trichocladiopsis TaxID=1682393 RepID=A0A9P8XX62_9PEZI|nr:uncharacterized protein B0I36DRAFT_394115 [Microdochium trichocladiopsis]KAH7021546.1 hypothetical protein B0I36DRAFT_394115 [Microdochium trichocladiopsis]